MIKKVFSFLLAFSMLSASIVMPIRAEEVTNTVSAYELSADEKLLMNLGIIDGTDYDGNDIMTRGEFAVLLAKTLNLKINEQTESSTGVPPVDDSQIVNPTSIIFKDVNVSSEEYGGIMAVYENGYMVGVSQGLFAPEYGIVLSDATKVFVDILGFHDLAQSYGGYRAGYEKVAYSYSLLNGVGCGFTDVATKKDIAALLCNVMETDMAQIENEKLGYTISEDETFIEAVMKMAKVTGVITDNGLTALDGASALYPSQILCNGIVMNIDEKETYARKYLGRRVTAYYTVNDDEEYELVFAEPKDEVVVISAKDYAGFDNGVLKYYSEKNTVKNVNIGLHSNVIYNAVYTQSYTKDIFDVADGNITIIPDGNEYTVIIEDYKSMVVSKTATEKSTIYNKITFNNSKYGINSVNLDDYSQVCLFDSAGETISFSSIKKDDVVSVMLSPDYKYAEVIVSTDKRSNVKFTGTSTDTYVTETEKYDYLDVFKNASNEITVKLGKAYTVYFNVFGNLVWIEEATDEQDGYKEGILLKLVPDEDHEDRFSVRVYESNGSVKTYYVQGKVKLNLATKKAQQAYSSDDLDDAIGKPILYTAEETIISEMITPLGYTEEDDQRGWYQITYDYLEDENVDRGIKHIDAGNGASFGGLLSYNRSECNIYSVPHEEFGPVWSNKERITINEKNFTNHQLYRIEGYAREKNSPLADVLVYRDKEIEGTPDPRNALLLTKVYYASNNDEISTVFEGYEFNQPGIMTKTSYVVAEHAKIVNEMNTITSKSYNDLKPGDIIRFSENAKGEISYIAMSYDYNSGVVSNTCCKEEAYTYKGYMMSIGDEGFKIVVPGEVTNGTDKETVSYTPGELTNLLKTPNLTPLQLKEYATMIRTYLSGANYPVVIVNTSGNKLVFEEATLDDVYAYEDTLSESDTVVVCTHYLGGKMGTVVYR